MLFKIKADAIFEASDIDDAFEKLATHFKGLSDGELDLDDHLIDQGRIDISPAEQK
jgi:hypothetical protein